MALSSMTVLDSTATTKTLSELADLNNGDYLMPRVSIDQACNPIACYAAGKVNMTMAATPTDILEITGSASKIVRVRQIVLSGFSTSGGTMDFALAKNTTADSGGTAATPDKTKFDSGSASASAVVNCYSANPTVGTQTILLGFLMPFPTEAANIQPIVFDFTRLGMQLPTLRGVAQALCVIGNGDAVPTGARLSVGVIWEESSY